MINDNNNNNKDIKHIHIDKNYIHGTAKIDIGCSIEGVNNIGYNVHIEHNSVLNHVIVGKSSRIDFSYVEDSIIGDNSTIGPFARIRPNSRIGNNVKIGNFVEIKNSSIGDNTKISHLAQNERRKSAFLPNRRAHKARKQRDGASF